MLNGYENSLGIFLRNFQNTSVTSLKVSKKSIRRYFALKLGLNVERKLHQRISLPIIPNKNLRDRFL